MQRTVSDRLRIYLHHHPAAWISVLMTVSSALVQLPFLLGDFNRVYRHWDGPFYMYIAKTMYIIPPDHPFQNVSTTFYAAFLPAYPILIRILSWFTFGNYPQAMILATLVSSIVAAILFFHLLREWELVQSPAWTTILFCFLPARWLLVHSVGANEPLFLCFIFGALLAFKKQKDGLVFLCVFFACLTRAPGVLLIPAFCILYFMQNRWRPAFLLPFAISGIVGLFVYYHFVYGDFFAFFNLHLNRAFGSLETKASAMAKYPFAIFNFYSVHANFHSTEYYALLYLGNLIGIILLWKRKELFVYTLIFFLFSTFQFTFDLPRYLIPVMPFTMLVAFDSFLSRRAVRYVAFPLAVYFAYSFAWGFLPQTGCSPEHLQIMMQHFQR